MKKVLTIGAAMRDVFISYAGAPSVYLHMNGTEEPFLVLPEGKKIEIEAITYFSGGGATNAAASFARLGFKVQSFFKYGADAEGTFIINDLAKEKVDTSNAMVSPDTPTGASFIIPCKSGDKVALTYRGANNTLIEKDIPYSAIEANDCIYITSLSNHTSKLLPIITAHAKKNKKMVAINPGTSQLTVNTATLWQALPDTDIVIMNSYEAQLCLKALLKTGEHNLKHKSPQEQQKNLPELVCSLTTIDNRCFDIAHFCKEVLSHGPKIVVVTNGAEGVYVATQDYLLFHPSIPTKIINTLGAGDAFGSCFVAHILNETPIEQALIAGIINSSSVLEHSGAKTGLLDNQQLKKRQAHLKISATQKYQL
jgi:sugar/nucleoside kinase (ribokinase family)